MMERIENVVEMKGSMTTIFLIFSESSATIIEIAREYLDDNLPSYMFECDYNDYFVIRLLVLCYSKDKESLAV